MTPSSTRAPTTRPSSSRPRWASPCSPWSSSTTARRRYAVPGRIAARFATEGWQVVTVDGRDQHALAARPLRPRRRRPERRRRHRPRQGARRMTVLSLSRDPRTQFGRTVTDLLDDDLSSALVYAEISGRFFTEAERRFPERVVNVGIREQLLVNVGAGLRAHRDAADRAHLRHVPGRARLRAGQARLRPPGRRRRARRRRRLVRRLARRPHPPGAGRRRPDGHAARGRHPRTRHLGRDRRGATAGGRRRGTALRPGRRADQHRVVRRTRPPRRTPRIGRHRGRPRAGPRRGARRHRRP